MHYRDCTTSFSLAFFKICALMFLLFACPAELVISQLESAKPEGQTSSEAHDYKSFLAMNSYLLKDYYDYRRLQIKNSSMG